MSLKHPDARLASLASGLNGEESLPAHTVWNAGSLGDWLLTAALRHPSAVLLRQMAGVDSLSVLPCETAWHVDCVSVPVRMTRPRRRHQRLRPIRAWPRISAAGSRTGTPIWPSPRCR